MTCSVEDLSKLFEAALDAWGDWLKRQDEWPRVEAVLKGFADLEDVRLPAFWIRNLEERTVQFQEHLTTLDDVSNLQSLLEEKFAIRPIKDKCLARLGFLVLKNLADWLFRGVKSIDKDDAFECDIKEKLELHKGKRKEMFNLEHSKVLERYFFGLCPIEIKTGNASLKACSGCYSVCYSGRDAQKAHWKSHKAICKSLQPLVKNSPGFHPLSASPKSKSNSTKNLQPYLETTLGRELNQFESDMLAYPRLCAVCLDGHQAKLKNCPECQCVCYCSEEHREEDQEEHAKSCGLLKIALEDYAREKSRGHKFARLYYPKPIPTSASSKLPISIDELFRADLSRLINFVAAAKSNNLEGKEKSNFEVGEDSSLYEASEVRHLTYLYTCQLTSLYGLQVASGAEGLDQFGKLVIHVVGARQAETTDVTRWEIFHYLMPKLQQLTVVFIGPELTSPYPLDDFQTSSSDLTLARPNLRAKPRYLFVKQAYHDFVEAKKSPHPEVKRPDLVVALNCGFIFYDSWNKSFQSMIKYANVPLLFTEYYEEDCRLDLQKFDAEVDDELEIVLRPTSNPFCSSLPARIPTSFAFRKFKRRNVVMSNDFICVVRSMPCD